MPATRPVSDVLFSLGRTSGSRPLLTHYDARARTELSAASFSNWVDKTANLLDELGVEGDWTVTLPVLTEAPTHWMALVWPFALWRRGTSAFVTDRSEPADVVVIGPDAPAPLGSTTTYACSLAPWGQPLFGLPSGVDDFTSEALVRPDIAVMPMTNVGTSVAWADDVREATFDELAALDPITDRVLACPTDAWAAVSLLVRVILGGGSLVLAAGVADLDGLAASERARFVGVS